MYMAVHERCMQRKKQELMIMFSRLGDNDSIEDDETKLGRAA